MRINWSIVKTPLITLAVSDVLLLAFLLFVVLRKQLDGGVSIFDPWYAPFEVFAIWPLVHLGPTVTLFIRSPVGPIAFYASITAILAGMIASYFIRQNAWTPAISNIGIFCWILSGIAFLFVIE